MKSANFENLGKLVKPAILSVVIEAMNNLKHVRFFWQLLALLQRLDQDPYSLSSKELALLKSYQINKARITKDQ